MGTSNIDGQLTTDASHIGWGATYNGKQAQGFWNVRVARQSSNYRELLTVLMALQSFKQTIVNKCIQVLSDNITTVAYLNHMGGPSEALTKIAKAIWAVCLEQGITIIARHLPGVQNVEADMLSRLLDKFEWRLNPCLFGWLDTLWRQHTIDRFASMLTTQTPVYNSRFLDPLSQGVDALAQNDWAEHNNFVNPPFRMIPQILDTIVSQKATATIIAPWWPAQPWAHRLRQLSIRPPIRLPNNRRAFWGNQPEPLRNCRWKIYAWRLCGMNV